MSKLEYLDENYKLHVIDGENDAVPESWILVPNGAEILVELSKSNKPFYKNDFKSVWNKNSWVATVCDKDNLKVWQSLNVLWQRESKSDVVEDVVNSPSHYAKGGVECIDAIESSMTKEAFCGYLKGNIQKYVFRYENKGGVESLQKAQWYLNKLIEVEGK